MCARSTEPYQMDSLQRPSVHAITASVDAMIDVKLFARSKLLIQQPLRDVHQARFKFKPEASCEFGSHF
jgi:hypothetical protein